MNGIVDIRTRADGKFDWHLTAANGEELCSSNQGYENRGDCLDMARKITRGTYATSTFTLNGEPF